MVRAVPCRVTNHGAVKPRVRQQGYFLKVNVDDEGELAARYDVRSIPSVVLFKNGKEIDRLIGAAPKDYYRRQIDRFLAEVRR